MKITKIAQQEKRTDRYSIFVDGKYAFSLSEAALLDSDIATGQELTDEELVDWKRQSADDKIYGNTLRYASMRSRSIWEVESYLRRKDASPTLAAKILNKLSDIGLLDDQLFARSWIATRRLLRPASKRKLQQELRAKRVSENIVREALGDDEADERMVLRELIAKKRQLPKYKADELKLMQYLARQGFSYEDIKSALNTPEND